MIVEIARFWASAATYSAALDRYEIRGVMGPDEYHDRYPGADRPGLDNNAYTNVMAVWVLCRAAETLDLLPADVRAQLRDRLAYEIIPRNVDYDLRRSAHDSTLSRVADAWVLARGDRPRSWDVFMEALVTDVADIQGGTTSEGIHLGALAGTVDRLRVSAERCAAPSIQVGLRDEVHEVRADEVREFRLT